MTERLTFGPAHGHDFEQQRVAQTHSLAHGFTVHEAAWGVEGGDVGGSAVGAGGCWGETARGAEGGGSAGYGAVRAAGAAGALSLPIGVSSAWAVVDAPRVAPRMTIATAVPAGCLTSGIDAERLGPFKKAAAA